MLSLPLFQLNAHIENVTAIAKRIPTAAVSHHIYIHLLRQVLLTMETADSSPSDQLKMIGAVHGVLPSRLSADGIAASLLTLLINRQESSCHQESNQLIKKLRALIRAIASELNSSFDGCLLLQSLLSFDIGECSWTIRDEENKARLMFQCVTLLAATSVSPERSQGVPAMRKPGLSTEEAIALKKNLTRARKLLLSWCCEDYAPLCQTTEQRAHENGNKVANGEDVAGAGSPDFGSILDGLEGSKYPPWLEVMRCVLLMENADSLRMQAFLAPDGSRFEAEPDWQEEAERINKCCSHGTELDDEMVWIVLKTALRRDGRIPSDIALPLLEHLFECCKKGQKSSLLLNDPNIIWELYNLVEYVPPVKPADWKRSLDHPHLHASQAYITKNENKSEKRNGIMIDETSPAEAGIQLPR